MIRIEDIVEKVGRNHPQADLDVAAAGLSFFSAANTKDKRAPPASRISSIRSKSPTSSPICGSMTVSVATGLLHDVVEDTLVDLERFAQYFGEEIDASR